MVFYYWPLLAWLKWRHISNNKRPNWLLSAYTNNWLGMVWFTIGSWACQFCPYWQLIQPNLCVYRQLHPLFQRYMGQGCPFSVRNSWMIRCHLLLEYQGILGFSCLLAIPRYYLTSYSCLICVIIFKVYNLNYYLLSYIVICILT